MIGNRYEYDAMAKCEQQMWWYRCLHELTFHTIKENSLVASPRILDAGCGTGGLLLYLKKKGYTDIAGFDLSPDAVALAGESTGTAVQLMDITLADRAYPHNYFDIIACHDILCLLQEGEDKTAFNALLSILKPGGLLLMNLPALQAFSGTHDVAVGIKKRYSKKELKKLTAGLAGVKKLIYWPFFLSPAIFFTRTLQKISLLFKPGHGVLSDVKMPPIFLNNAFHKLTSAENRYLAGKPWGSSLFLVAQKPALQTVKQD